MPPHVIPLMHGAAALFTHAMPATPEYPCS